MDAITVKDKIYIAWEKTQGNIYISESISGGSNFIDAFLCSGYNPTIASDDHNIIYVAYDTGNTIKIITYKAPVSYNLNQTITTGTLPVLRIVQNKFYIIYLDGNDIKYTYSLDGGHTWSTPKII